MTDDTTDELTAEVDDFDDDRGVPLDLTALRADDVLLSALAGPDPEAAFGGVDPELGTLLQSWRQDVRAEPVGELVDTDTAIYAIAQGSRQFRQRPKFLVPLASAAAVLVVLFTGVGLAARNAQPGDALWGLTQVLYADHARSVQAADVVRMELDHASAALQDGRLSTARTDLAGAMQALPSVASEDGQADLRAQGQTLAARLGVAGSTGGYPVTTSGSTPSSQPSVPTTPPSSVSPTSPVSPSSPPTTPSSPSSASQVPPPPTSGSSSASFSPSQPAPPPGAGGSGTKNAPGVPEGN